ncbi:MAG TPA: EAL domain-containing protein [Bradyrhizobium sp.]|uniref:bifunctional diguanylate cyclase/phosphodiesterase n=1 Tax=Bradyrhizobium sp. TaxID=376 RepID=UPI002C4F4FCD|nr:EAL domain-containing protein [Bradyrhizobium sp.]HTB04338.1 EAL domain-containing protein [Bradyrhizobium sp.]
MIAVLGTALSITGWFIVSGLEDRTSAAEFNLRANNMAVVLQNGINGYLANLSALRALFESAPAAVGEQEFLTFSDRLLRDHSAILSLSWVPLIRNEERAAHEQAAQQATGEDYRIRSVSKDGTLGPSPAAAEYFPVYYTTEKIRTHVVRGLNLADSGIRQQPLEKARDGGTLAASQEFPLQSGTGDRIGFFVVLPIYKRGLPHNSIEERRRNLVGFVQGVFQIDTMIAATLRGIQIPADYYIFSSEAGSSARPLYTSLLKPSGEPLAASRRGKIDTAFHWSGKVAIADRQWEMIAVPEQRSILLHLRAWIILTAGLCLTGVVFAFMWQANRHTRKLAEANKTISELARTDPLTALANRRVFQDRMAAAFEKAKCSGERFAVLYIDLDHFKDFNDLMGHPAGDALLVQVGKRLLAVAGDADCVARFGGDEFAILQSNAGAEGASEALAEKIVAALNETSMLEGHAARISASIGVSRYVEELDGPDAMLMQADLALYRAKDAGRNRACIHDKTFDQLACDRVILGRELMAAIESGGLALHYQPQVDIDSGRIVGLEALVRWNHVQRGPISPALFIPIAEKTGSIVDLGKWVFDEACRQTRVWQDEGIDAPSVAVNVSAIQCKRPELEQDIVASLTRWKIAPGRIELELTESVLMEATQHHRDIIARLRTLGLRLAIDDFGTGYSSLNYLTNFPVDRIKIAQELIFNCTTKIRCAAVVRAAIHLAEELDTEVLAEGVENAEHARFLSSAGCKFAQGYFFSRPVDAAQATALLRGRFIRPPALLPAPKDSGGGLIAGRLRVV